MANTEPLPKKQRTLAPIFQSMSTAKSKASSDAANTKWNDLIEQIFLVRMPSDFFLFWQFCKQISPRCPQSALSPVLGLQLVGPFDVLAGRVTESNIDDDGDTILTHWRFFYDPPELQTFAIVDVKSTLTSDFSTSYHLGYFRDLPEETSPVVVSNDAEKSCIITGVADNIFAAVYSELLKRKTSNRANSSYLDKAKHFESQLKAFASLHKIELNASAALKARKAKINAPTFHKFGIVVEVVNDVGYRELPETDANLKRIIERITRLEEDDQRRKCASMKVVQDIMTRINYANDEKDFGMGLEFGIDLFCTGHKFFHKSARHLLKLAYDLLDRDVFGRIIEAHIENRRVGRQLDVTRDG